MLEGRLSNPSAYANNNSPFHLIAACLFGRLFFSQKYEKRVVFLLGLSYSRFSVGSDTLQRSNLDGQNDDNRPGSHRFNNCSVRRRRLFDFQRSESSYAKSKTAN